MKRNFSFQTVAIAIDNRSISIGIAKACSAVLQQLGIQTVYYGVVPTPVLAYVAMQDGMPAIMFTGSHTPFDRNGLKFYRPDGDISKDDETDLLTEEVSFDVITNLPELNIHNRAKEAYIVCYTSLFNDAWLTGKRIGIYEHSSAGRDIY